MDRKVSINKVDKMIKICKDETKESVSFQIDGEEIIVSVKLFLSPGEEYGCVNSIVDAVFIDGEYTPEAYQSSVLMNFIAYYTNLKVEIGLDRLYMLTYGSNVMGQLMSCVNPSQWNHICESAQKKIAYRVETDINMQKKKIDELMQNIAMENNISETVFTIKNGNNYDVYWFTPKCEIDFCGHAVLAVAYAILNFAEKESNEVSLNTKEGILTIRKKDDLYEMDTPNYDLKPIEITSDIIEAIGGIKPLEAYIGRDIVCVLEDENQVINAKPNLEIIKKLDGLLFHITSDVKYKENNQYDSITRTFGPKLDADEVDVCGSRIRTLSYYTFAFKEIE